MRAKIGKAYTAIDTCSEMDRINEEMWWVYESHGNHKIKTSKKYVNDIKKEFNMSDESIKRTFEFDEDGQENHARI